VKIIGSLIGTAEADGLAAASIPILRIQQFRRWAAGGDSSCIHYQDSLAEGQGLADRMCHVQNGNIPGCVPVAQIIDDLLSRRPIQCCERFVEQKRLWVGYERTRERYALALAAR